MSEKKTQVQIAKDMADGVINTTNGKLITVAPHSEWVILGDNKPIPFTLQEAIEHYKGNPTVMCLADETVCQIITQSIHSKKHPEHDEPWIWAYELQVDSPIDNNVLLYAPGKLSTDYYKAPILDS